MPKATFAFGALLIAAMLVMPFAAHASVIFSNTGTTSGFSLYVESQGSVSQVSSPVYKGSTALRARNTYNSSYSGRYHAEARKSGACQRNQDRYYGYAFYLPSNWQFVAQNYNIQQFIGTPSCGSGQPTVMTKILNDDLMTRYVSGPNGCDRTAAQFTVSTAVSRGVWHRVVIHGKWKSDNTGTFQLWYDGSQKVNKTNTKTHPADDYSLALAVGNYSNGWYDDKKMVGTQGTRDIFIDQVRITTSYSEADPASW